SAGSSTSRGCGGHNRSDRDADADGTVVVHTTEDEQQPNEEPDVVRDESRGIAASSNPGTTTRRGRSSATSRDGGHVEGPRRRSDERAEGERHARDAKHVDGTDNAEVADVRVAADDHAARNDNGGVKTTEVPKTTDATTTRSPTKPSPPTTRRRTKAATMGTDTAVTSQPTKTGASTVTNKKPRVTEVLQNTTNAQKTAVEQRR
ncbi:hypothetical protein PF001_g32293, partial [Phytophthora fragariae]